jgi:hypothetical protein
MKNGIPTNIYYQLLEWKDSNMSTWYDISKVFGGRSLSLSELSPFQLKIVYMIAFEKEMPTTDTEYKPSHG